MAPEVDERYGTAVAWLQDDVARRRPSPSLALDLFCATTQEASAVRPRLMPGAPLHSQRLLASPVNDAPLLSRPLVLDEQIRRLLLGEPGLDSRLARWCRLAVPDRPIALGAPLGNLSAAIARTGDASGLRIAVGGRTGLGQHRVASAIAVARSSAVLRVDLEALGSFPAATARELVGVLVREAVLHNAVLELAPAEVLAADPPWWLGAAVADLVAGADVPTVLRNDGSGSAPTLAGAGLLPVELTMPAATGRREHWAAAAGRHGLALTDRELDALAERYRLAPDDIDTAARRAVTAMRCGIADGDPADACAAQARSTGGHRLTELAQRVRPRFGWHDLVLPPAVEQQLRELCDRAAVHGRVLDRWGFAEKLSLGRGIAALFGGPSGTGKSMAAEVVAGALGLDLFRINLATVVDKYIGETEKNLDAIFRAGADANGILLFDEADALFGKRSEVRDAHDRYTNLEVSYLLQRMEEYDGLAILSTNLYANIDEAFVRRLAAIVWFPFPEPPERAEIWRRVWPSATPVEPLDIALLAERFPLSGGNIKGAALAAAGFAAADGGVVTAEHVRRAVRREYQKMGRTLTAEELGVPERVA
jgi:hypothetical protein